MAFDLLAAAVGLRLLNLIFPRSQRDANLPTSQKSATTEQVHPLRFEVPHFVQPPPPLPRIAAVAGVLGCLAVAVVLHACSQELCLHAFRLAEPG